VHLSLRCGDLGDIYVTEDTSQDHPDHMRVVIALNAEQCPDCGAYGFDYKPRIGMSRNIFCKACDQGFNVSPDPPRVFFVQRHGRRRPA
jgi:hypothetical protein